ncbi:hypothetical protein GDO86_013431 [Hymenochirus boettgeri]|uniref:Fibronectin type-III domain-containing protein n=1 Tax=Hymenochirus boettgeri TaxID=247094 RepID=A0A8T2IUT5_9PIPI|nr:hypothetical protein GDO86_013431 [Hymenochirus boettgeri]
MCERYFVLYRGYARQHTIEGLETSTPYRFRLKVTGCNGEFAYSPVVSVSTTREPLSGQHLHRAVNMNDEKEVKNILDTGHVHIDIMDKLGFAPLMTAAQKGYFGLTQLLIEHGADVNQVNGSGRNSLMMACFAGHLNIVQYLRKHGASWESRDKGGCTAMHWAVDGGHLEVVQWMIDDSCKIDIKDTCLEWTPLMRVAAISGNVDVARCLIASGADVNAKDINGKSSLMVAVLNNHECLIHLLIQNGADCTITNEYGISVTEMAKAFNRENVVALLEGLKTA